MVSAPCLKLVSINTYVRTYFVIICSCHFGLADRTFCQAFSVGRTFTSASTVASNCIVFLSLSWVVITFKNRLVSVHKTLHYDVFSTVAHSHGAAVEKGVNGLLLGGKCLSIRRKKLHVCNISFYGFIKGRLVLNNIAIALSFSSCAC